MTVISDFELKCKIEQYLLTRYIITITMIIRSKPPPPPAAIAKIYNRTSILNHISAFRIAKVSLFEHYIS